MMRRIVHLIDSWGPGGAESVFLDLVSGLDRKRYTSFPVVVAEGWLHDALRTAGLQPRLLASHRSFDLSYAIRLARLARDAKADLIHSHTIASNVYAGLAGLLIGLPVLSTLHGLIDLALDDRWRRLKFAIIRRASPRLVCVSEYLRQQLLATTSICPSQVGVVHNGIDATHFRPGRERRLRQELGLAPDDFLVGAVGNTRAEKGFDVLLRVAALLRQRLSRARTVIVGEMQQPVAADLEAECARLGLGRHVVFAGHRSNMPEVLASFDCFVITSVSEGFSLATVEALACGVPVIASRCGGPEEIVAHEVNGLLVPVNDAPATADAICRLAASKELCHRLVEAGRMSVLKRFSAAAMIRGYEDLYDLLAPAQ